MHQPARVSSGNLFLKRTKNVLRSVSNRVARKIPSAAVLCTLSINLVAWKRRAGEKTQEIDEARHRVSKHSVFTRDITARREPRDEGTQSTLQDLQRCFVADKWRRFVAKAILRSFSVSLSAFRLDAVDAKMFCCTAGTVFGVRLCKLVTEVAVPDTVRVKGAADSENLLSWKYSNREEI